MTPLDTSLDLSHLSVCPQGGVCHTLQADTLPGQTPPPGDISPRQTAPGRPPGYGQQAGGTHPTGMHSC